MGLANEGGRTLRMSWKSRGLVLVVLAVRGLVRIDDDGRLAAVR